MGKPDPPDPPDYTEIAEASEYAADLSFQIAQDQLAWAQEQYASGLEMTEPVLEEFMETLEFTNAVAEADRARYEQLYQPLEEELIAEAESYASPERIAEEMGRAQASVAEQYNASREAAQMQLESYGLNPADVRYAALDIDTRTDQAAAAAAAGEQAFQQTEAKADAMRSEALNIGKGYPAQIASSYDTAMKAGTGVVGGTTSTQQTGSNMMTAPSAYMQTGNSALDVWGNTINQGYQNELSSYNAALAATSGLGTALGTITSLAMPMFGYQEGGEVQRYDYQHGGPVPHHASPTRGARPDDVPANLTAGEFVVPEDVVRWKGSEYFYKEIEKSRQKRQEAMTGAVPASTPRPQGQGGQRQQMQRPPMPQQQARPPGGMGGQPMRRPTTPIPPGVPPVAPRMARPAPRAGAGALPVGGRPAYARGGEVAPRRPPLRMQAGGAPEDYLPVGVDPGSGAYYDPASGQWFIPPSEVPEEYPYYPSAANPIVPAVPMALPAESRPYRREIVPAAPAAGGGFASGFANALAANYQPRPGSLSELIRPDPRGSAATVAPGVVPAASGGMRIMPGVTSSNAAAAPGVVPAAARPVPDPRVSPTGATATVAPLGSFMRSALRGEPPSPLNNMGAPPPGGRGTLPLPSRMGAPPPGGRGTVDMPRPLSQMGAPPPPFSSTNYGIGPARGSFRGAQEEGLATTSTSSGGRTRSGEPTRVPRARPERQAASGRTVRPSEMRSRGDVTGREKPVKLKPGQITAEPKSGSLSAESFARQAQDYMRSKKGKNRRAAEPAVAATTPRRRERPRRQPREPLIDVPAALSRVFRREDEEETA